MALICTATLSRAVTYGTAHIYKEIEQLLNQYLVGLKGTLSIYKQGNVEAELDQVHTDKEKNLMDSIQSLLTQAEQTKVRFLSASEASLAEMLDFQKATESVSFMMIFLIGVVFLWQVKSRLLHFVNALKSHLSLFGDELGELKRKLPEAHQRIDVVSRNLLELVNSSLDYQRISSGHYEL